MIDKICFICKKNFKACPANIRRGFDICCSKKCDGVLRGIGKRIERVCGVCGQKDQVLISLIKAGRGKYCSKKCSNLAMKTKLKLKCEICNRDFETHLCKISKSGGKYCSYECTGIAISGDKSKFWKGGKSDYPKEWTKRLTKSIRDRDNNRCMRCGRAREEFKRALSVHHISADKNDCSVKNLITLCDWSKGSCHGLTKGKEEIFAKGFRSLLNRSYGYKYGGGLTKFAEMIVSKEKIIKGYQNE